MSSSGNAWKWWIAVVLFLATVLTYLDRQTLSLCGAMISAELNLSNEQYGELVAAFRWTYALVHFLNEWIPKYLHDQRGMGYLSAGLVTVPMFLGADLGNLLSGGLIKVLTLRGWSLRAARGTTLTLAALLILPVGLIGHVESVYLAVAMLSMAAMGITSIVANYTACQQDFSFANVGMVAGILGMSCNVFAALVNPLIGRYVDHTGHYGLIFLLMAMLPLVSLGAVLVFDALVTKEPPRA